VKLSKQVIIHSSLITVPWFPPPHSPPSCTNMYKSFVLNFSRSRIFGSGENEIHGKTLANLRMLASFPFGNSARYL